MKISGIAKNIKPKEILGENFENFLGRFSLMQSSLLPGVNPQCPPVSVYICLCVAGWGRAYLTHLESGPGPESCHARQLGVTERYIYATSTTIRPSFSGRSITMALCGSGYEVESSTVFFSSSPDVPAAQLPELKYICDLQRTSPPAFSSLCP